MPHIPYERYEGLIGHTVTKFHKTYKGDYEEIRCRANYWFCVAWHAYDARKGDFSQWVSNTIWHRLLDDRDKDKAYKRLIEKITPSRALPVKDDAKSGFNLEVFSKKLSARGRVVLELIFTPPSLAKEFIRDRGEYNHENIRNGVKDFLIHQGWRKLWIKQSFAEIRNVLQNGRSIH